MREILFRGKRIDNGNFVYGYYIKENGSPFIIQKEEQEFFIEESKDPVHTKVILVPYEVNPETIGQFTGLLDKNGNKVFEGDVLDNNEIVTYSNGCFMTSIGALALSVNHREIIGNIHD